MRIFISYTLRDGVVDADFLNAVRQTQSSNFTTFIDIIDNDSVDVQSRIRSEIEYCDLFLILRTPSYRTSPWAIQEINWAREYGKLIKFHDVDNTRNDFAGCIRALGLKVHGRSGCVA